MPWRSLKIMVAPCRALVMCLVIGMAPASIAQARIGLVTLADLRKIAPNAQEEYLQTILDLEPELDAAGINTRLRMAHFLAQVLTETGGLARLDENMNYSYKTLLRVFSRKTISDQKARDLAHNPVEIANWVYGNRLGNLGRGTQDGWNFRGSGYIQLTGRGNFRQRGAEIGINLEGDPEMARQAREGLLAAIAFWQARKINAAADDSDRLRVRILVNGPAAHGAKQADIWFRQAWTRVFKAKEADGFESAVELATTEAETENESALFDDILVEGGLVSADELANEAGGATARTDALKAYQAELGLPESGELDAATQGALLDPREWRYQDDTDTAQAEPTERDGEQTVVFEIAASAAGEESGEVAPAATTPDEGSGALAATVELTGDTLAFLDGARSLYPDYEMGGHALSAPETFKPFSVFGDDTRVAVTDTTVFPARAIVQILFESPRGKSLCSGVMISADTVLTAAHCVHSGTVNGQPFRNYSVVPGRNVGAAPFGTCGVVKGYVLSGWSNSITTDEARYFDLGALRLDCTIGKATGWFGLMAPDEDALGAPLVVQGYAADLAPTGRQWQSEDKIRLLWATKGFHQADTFGGTSGAPVSEKDAPGVVIGVHTNGQFGADDPWASNNAFTRITPERLARIQTWIGD